MCFFFSFLPATVWAVIGYFILFSSTKAEGGVKTLGQWLAIWAFVISGFILIAGAYITMAGLCPLEALMQGSG
jgi:hypothetical protein